MMLVNLGPGMQVMNALIKNSNALFGTNNLIKPPRIIP